MAGLEELVSFRPVISISGLKEWSKVQFHQEGESSDGVCCGKGFLKILHVALVRVSCKGRESMLIRHVRLSSIPEYIQIR